MYVAFCKFSTCGCGLFNYIVIKLVTYTVCICLNRSCTQCVCEKYKRSIYHCNYWLISKGKLWLNGNYNLCLIIFLDFFIYRLLLLLRLLLYWTSYSWTNFVTHFAVFSYYMYWFIYSGSHLHILVRF